MKASTKLRQLLQGEEIIVAPGAQDVLTAKIVEKMGFPAIYGSGYGAIACLLGTPDIGLLTMTEMADHFRRMAHAVDIPIIADMDTGYGPSLQIWRAMRVYEGTGIAAIQLEDQVLEKRCGHMAGKRVVSMEEMLKRIEAVVKGREDEDIVIIGRTDTISTHDLDEAIRRAKAYVKAGADAIFVEALPSIDAMKKVCDSIDRPLLITLIERGKVPFLTPKELQDMGFKIVSHCVSSLYSNAYATTKLLKELKETGTTEDSMDSMIAFGEFNELVGLPQFEALQKKLRAE